MRSRQICGVRVDAVTYESALAQVITWARNRESRTVCFSNVHMIMEAQDSLDYRRILSQSDLVTPDGVPLVWALRLLGFAGASRVYGPDFTMLIAERAAQDGIPIALYGGSDAALANLNAVLSARFPNLRVVYSFAPPFRPLTAGETEDHVRAIAESGAQIVLVGLGCPKQERWMADQRGRIPAVMLGVGAAFDFLSGAKPQAPRWMMRAGLEWLFRLITEPRRLWARYLKQNPRFVMRFTAQLLRESFSGATR